MTLLLLAVGGVAGALCRYHGVRLVHRQYHGTFPLGTLLVNLSGCLALGLLVGLLMHHPTWPTSSLALLLGTGFCGAYTTFSSFAFDTVQLWRQRRSRAALLNAVAQPLLGTILAALGLLLGRLL